MRGPRSPGPAQLVERLPSPTEYIGLRSAVGWPSPATDECERALQGSLAAVCAVDESEVVGIGRLVGDGALNCWVVDVVVDPRYQGRGIGRAIVEQLEAVAIQQRLCGRLDLVATSDVVPFYRRLGYSALDSELMRKAL